MGARQRASCSRATSRRSRCEWAEELAANAPLSVRGNKRVIRALLRAGAGLDPDVERELIELRRACFASEDMREGVRAFAEKRPARWRGK